MRPLYIELLEQRPHALLCCKFIDGESSCDEVVIVYDTVASEINFLNDSLEILFAHCLVTLANGCSEFVDLHCSRPIRVHLVELFTQVCKLLWIDHFNKNLQAFSSESVLTVELLETSEDRSINSHIFDTF